MRPKVVVVVMVFASLLLGLASWISSIARPHPAASGAKTEPDISLVASGPATSLVNHSSPMVASIQPQTTAQNENTNAIVLQGAEHAEHVQTRSAELEALAMQPEAEAHQTIVSELKNPDKAIREAALEALKQVSDRSVVPQMQEIADQTGDAVEKQAILDAIDYINLPSLTEYLHSPKAQGAAGRPPTSPINLPK